MKTGFWNRALRRFGTGAASAVMATALVSMPQAASACGGFFCSQVPVDQTGERVLFAVDDVKVRALIQIFYQGEASKFSWVLPLPAAPDKIGVSSNAVFTALEQQTNPQFQLTWNYKDNCYYNWGFAESDSDGAPTAGGGKNEDGGVRVLQEGAVGPFDFAVIKAENATADGAEAMYQWLDDNGYDQPEFAKDLIATYVAESHVFVAVKLQKDKVAGDIQPLSLEYPFPGGCVPLRLTSIAAKPDMEVWAYMLGQHRAVPVNFFHVDVNETQIDWLNYGSNYREMAGKAVDTAAGRAFLTEYAGDTNSFEGLLWRPGQYDLTTLNSVTTPMAYLQAALNMGLPRDAQMQEVIKKWIPKPADLPEDCNDDAEFYTWNMENCQQYMPSGYVFDPIGMTADIEDKLIVPMKEAQALFDEFGYLTRLFTKISPLEMTRDPIFLFNADMPNVSNVHKAYATPFCAEGQTQPHKVVVTLNDGTELNYEVPVQFGPPILEAGFADAPASSKIERMYTEGAPEEVTPATVAKVDKDFESITVGLLIASNSQPTTRVVKTGSGESAGCSAGASGTFTAIGGVSLLGLAGLLGLRRRKVGTASQR